MSSARVRSTPDAAVDAELVGRVRLAVTRLARQLRQQSEDELTPTQNSALATILRQGPISLRVLADVERVSAPTVTRVVDKLEEGGLVRRLSDPGDRRVTLVEPTERAVRMMTVAKERRQAWLTGRFAELDAGEIAALAAAAGPLEKLLDRDTP